MIQPSFDTEYEKGNEQEVDENDSEGKEDEEEVEDSDDEYINGKKKDNTVMQKYTQAELNDLVRNLGLSKEGAEFLASDLKRKNLLTKETRVTVYRNREKNFRKYFTHDNKSSLFYSTDINGLMNEIKKNTKNKNGDYLLTLQSVV